MTSLQRQLFGLHDSSQANFDDQAAEVLDLCFLEFSEFPEVMEDYVPIRHLRTRRQLDRANFRKDFWDCY